MEFRIEHDALGEMKVPATAYYGIQTERAQRNFAVSGKTIGEYPLFIRSLAAIKKAAALANKDIGALSPEVADAICRAADEIMAGQHFGEFPMDVFQGGGGTSANMNANEVIANRANEILTGSKGYEKVHPNTHVNMGQSTNDVIPSAMHLCFYAYLLDLAESLEYLERVLERKTEEFKAVVTIARTCIQDALPITLGQEFSGYWSFIRRQIALTKQTAQDCTVLPLGGTAVGTGLGTFPGYMEHVFHHLALITGLEVVQDKNLFDGLQNGDVYVKVSAALKSAATGLGKMARDLRLLSSGPRAGFREIELPAVQPGSSIMPGKINPVMPELMNQICYQVCGNDVAVTMAVEGGELDLNVWEPVIIKCIAESATLLTNSVRLFADQCVAGIRANEEVCRTYAESALAIATVPAALFGYEQGTAVAKTAQARGISAKQATIELGLLTQDEADELMDPLSLTDYQVSSRILALQRERNTKG